MLCTCQLCQAGPGTAQERAIWEMYFAMMNALASLSGIVDVEGMLSMGIRDHTGVQIITPVMMADMRRLELANCTHNTSKHVELPPGACASHASKMQGSSCKHLGTCKRSPLTICADMKPDLPMADYIAGLEFYIRSNGSNWYASCSWLGFC